eukprot:COSAG06_NODE_54186_length_296_cov_0.451777_1_plen_90_part_10
MPHTLCDQHSAPPQESTLFTSGELHRDFPEGGSLFPTRRFSVFLVGGVVDLGMDRGGIREPPFRTSALPPPPPRPTSLVRGIPGKGSHGH